MNFENELDYGYPGKIAMLNAAKGGSTTRIAKILEWILENGEERLGHFLLYLLPEAIEEAVRAQKPAAFRLLLAEIKTTIDMAGGFTVWDPDPRPSILSGAALSCKPDLMREALAFCGELGPSGPQWLTYALREACQNPNRTAPPFELLRLLIDAGADPLGVVDEILDSGLDLAKWRAKKGFPGWDETVECLQNWEEEKAKREAAEVGKSVKVPGGKKAEKPAGEPKKTDIRI
jgi:hypothetical protein